ncbi:MAG TPA: 4-(cytidine 5'-diphospho)-2-C-methyl-D-erythritol kinase [Candidatus Cloacimonadota bacterium]|nr:4-(cytidine 5'-diphospho)-2-C-methyl-D-erythritol kinase [Candidatus Cloacimonadota bacterium]
MRNSYAKINLYLDVLGSLPDGYHEILTIFTEIDLKDVLKFTLTRSRNIEFLTNVEAISNRENLVYKVAHFIQQEYQIENGVKMVLEKNIPIAAGMGGGSSNAAATIQGLSELWDLNLTDHEMNQIAAKFGNDISFFLYGGTALGTHKGEVITPIPSFLDKTLLLVKPDFGISAKEAYDCVDYGSQSDDWELLIKNRDVTRCFNRLEKGIIKKYPMIGEILDRLDSSGASKAIMTGSGSTCVGFFDDPATMMKAKKEFELEGYWTYCARILNRM